MKISFYVNKEKLSDEKNNLGLKRVTLRVAPLVFSSSILVVFCFGRLPLWSSFILVLVKIHIWLAGQSASWSASWLAGWSAGRSTGGLRILYRPLWYSFR